MQLTYQLSQSDFINSIFAHRKHPMWRRWFYRLLALLATVSVAFLLFVIMLTPTREVVKGVTPSLLLAVLWIGLIWVLPYWSGYRQFRKQPRVHTPRTIIWDEAGVRWEWEGGSRASTWKDFLQWTESAKHFLLYGSPVSFEMVPKRAMTSDQEQELRRLLDSHVRQIS
jgi:hypothetical protein